RRFVDKEAGLDLDLSYVTPALIAMGFPSKSFEAMYRNPINDVEKFLDTRHEGAYKVYNLCSERSYSDQRFHGRVIRFPFPDHSPPPFQLIHPFCEDVSDWLHSTAGNVVAVHCKAGKGRTGVMICAFLVHCGATADEAIKLYGEKRTMDGCGVTIPSQMRYIHYYEQFLESRTLTYDPRLLTLHEIVIDTIPKQLQGLEYGSNYLILTIMSSDTKIYESLPQHCTVDHQLQQIRISITDKIVLAGDVKMMLWYDSLYKRCHLCHFCFNTTFIDNTKDNLYLKKSEVDKACKDKLHSIFDKEFGVSVHFSPALARQSPLPTLDSLPNRAILLKYKNHNGPNSVEVSPPSFSTLRLSPARKKSALSIAVTASGSTLVSIIQPEIRIDLETRVLTVEEQKETMYESPPPSPSSSLFHSGQSTSNSSTATSPPSSGKKNSRHSATSPLAREVRFESESRPLSTIACNGTANEHSHEIVSEALQPKEELAGQVHSKSDSDSLEEQYLNEEGVPIAGSGKDSGVEGIYSNEYSRERERERGWVDSVSRWFWFTEGQKEQEPNGSEET
ncbi:hypothetical protein BGZ65_003571, partial [Modicella reniformis]